MEVIKQVWESDDEGGLSVTAVCKVSRILQVTK
jgi:uncharacterized protein (DUF302 family)